MQKIGDGKITFVCTDEMVQKIEKIAKRHNMSKSEAIRTTLEFGIDVYEDFEAVGIVKFGEILIRTKNAIRKGVGQQRLFA